jgi:starch synthase
LALFNAPKGDSSMNVLFASAEAVPFAKAGGLGDVVGSLPKYLRRQGVDARVLMPLYGSIDRAAFGIDYAFSFQFQRNQGTADVHVHMAFYDGVPFYFVATHPFFGEGNYLYTDWHWDMQRFIHFSELVQAVAWQLGQGRFAGVKWFPDVLHVNDWHTALAPFLLECSRNDPAWARVGSVLTIHNMGYQGPQGAKFLWDAGVPPRWQADLLYQGLGDNLLATGIAYSDVVTTVSPRYAIEMQYPRFGEGLEGMVRVRNYTGDVVGILNGIDMERANPETDKWVPHHFNSDNFLTIRPKNKAALQTQLGLPVRPEVPIIGVVTRLTDQKGFDLAMPALWQVLAESDVQLVALGSGEPALEHQLWQLSHRFSNQARALIGYDPVLSQRIYGASDLFLMPSRYEPCGTSQMFAMRYGSLPVVRETGGLADTVQNYDGGDAEVGTGFVFSWETPDAVLNTLRWAIETYQTRPEAFQRMQRRGLETDFGWERSAGEYIKIYERALAKHRPTN